METQHVSNETMGLIRKSLRSIPPKDSTPPMQKVIAKFERDIEHNLNKGYSISEVYELSFKENIAISLKTFRQYWKAIKNESLKKEKKALHIKEVSNAEKTKEEELARDVSKEVDGEAHEDIKMEAREEAREEAEKPKRRERIKVSPRASFVVQPDIPDDEL